jgi:hypothetical protein
MTQLHRGSALQALAIRMHVSGKHDLDERDALNNAFVSNEDQPI